MALPATANMSGTVADQHEPFLDACSLTHRAKKLPDSAGK
jgi:hypothetical protein